MFAPLPASAATFETVAPYSLAIIATVAAIATVAFVLARRKIRALASELSRVRAETGHLNAAVAGVAGGAYIWHRASGQQSASLGLLPLLGLDGDHDIGFTDIRRRLDPADSKALNAAIGRLHDTGGRFSLTLESVDGDVLRATGFRVETFAPEGGDADILWLQRETEAEAERAALTRDRGRLRGVLDALPLPVWLRNDDLDIADCNRTYVAAVEASSVDAVIGSGLELAASVVADHGKGLAHDVRISGAPETASHHIVVNGSRRLLDITEMPAGHGMIAGFALDVTDIEDAQAELARHVATHAEVLEKLATAIAIFGSDHRLKFFNSAYVRLWQLKEVWLHGEPAMEELLEVLRESRHLPETADFPAFKRSQLKLFTSLIESQEEMLHLPDGRTLRTVVAPHPMGGLLFTFEDVTDRLALERSYNTLIDVQRESLNNLAEAVAVFGPDGRLKLFNPSIEHMWGIAGAALASEPHISELIEKIRAFFQISGDWQTFKSAVIARLARRVARSGRIERTDGSVLDYGFLPLPDGGVLVKFLDVTDSIRVARALRERNEALEAADRLKSEFIANVSYELRTPLNTIMGFIEILNNQYFGKLNTRQLEYAEGILESSRELLGLINDILDLAMIEAGRMTLDLEVVEIPAMLQGIANLIRERTRQKHLSLAVECPPDIGSLELDERRAKHALLNLLGNAIEFTPDHGTIVLSARRDTGEMALSVTDNGVGIPDDQQSRIFDMFVRGKSPIGHRRGAGLGLSLVKNFIDLHGGRVEIESAPGAGTTVTCFFPLRRSGGRAALPADMFEIGDRASRRG